MNEAPQTTETDADAGSEPTKAQSSNMLTKHCNFKALGGIVGIFVFLALLSIGVVFAYWYVNEYDNGENTSDSDSTATTSDDDSDASDDDSSVADDDSSADTDDDADSDDTSDDDTGADDDGTSGLTISTADWTTYENSDLGISFKHPPSWTVDDQCEELGLTTGCEITVSDGEYEWMIALDPVVTGGGTGFQFDGVVAASDTRTEDLSVAGYDIIMITQFVDTNELIEAMNDASFNVDAEIWNWSVAFADENNLMEPGFGSGKMYDETDNNYWGIFYRYQSDNMSFFIDYPEKGNQDLEKMIDTMDAISESLGLS